MRLIDADALHDSIDKETYRHTYIEQIHSIIDQAPTIEAEQVVRCKNCKHYIPSKEMPDRGWCDDALQNLFKEDFYCGFGKRREP